MQESKIRIQMEFKLVSDKQLKKEYSLHDGPEVLRAKVRDEKKLE